MKKYMVFESHGLNYCAIKEDDHYISLNQDSLEDTADLVNLEPGQLAEGDREDFKDIIKQVDEYWSGHRREFDLKLQLKGTDFQIKVWKALLEIPYGSKLIYKDIAEKIGRDKAYQAVGTAIGRNPLMLIVPCHRVIGQKGLGGFRSGLEVKKRLLELEGDDE